ncbi:MAG: hypothetical protein AAGI88_18225 [Pseudomonadota bacterium]
MRNVAKSACLLICVLTQYTYAAKTPSDAVRAYLNALMLGDTAQLARYTTGQLLKVHERLLENPTYGQHLRDRYAGAAFEVTAGAPLGKRHGVRAKLSLADVGEVDRIFIVEDSASGFWQIVSELDTTAFCKQREHVLCSYAASDLQAPTIQSE